MARFLCTAKFIVVREGAMQKEWRILNVLRACRQEGAVDHFSVSWAVLFWPAGKAIYVESGAKIPEEQTTNKYLERLRCRHGNAVLDHD